jgi:hypothetical protein
MIQTSLAEHVGAAGTNLNYPMPSGCGDAEYSYCWNEYIAPELDGFKPGIVFVAAGFDAVSPLITCESSFICYRLQVIRWEECSCLLVSSDG